MCILLDIYRQVDKFCLLQPKQQTSKSFGNVSEKDRIRTDSFLTESHIFSYIDVPFKQ